MKKRPNIFDYATSELSQDAFLAWLIQWADEAYQGVDNAINACAASFVRKLLEKDNSFPIKTIKVERQWKKIDVCALVNEEYFIVIEDKKGTKEHSNQLARYSEIAHKYYKTSDVKIKLVYFKMEEQGKHQNVEEAGFSVFQRSKMLSILKDYMDSTEVEKQNAIIVDYFEDLESLDEKIKGYSTLKVDDWKWYPWQGFYSELQKRIGGNWDYVSNASGGFLGFWWNWKYSKINDKEFGYYLQLEHEKLVFKLRAYKEDERSEIRNFYRKHLYEKAKELDIKISQYGRIGTYMGVAKLDADYRRTDENGLLDFNKTIKNLEEIMNLLNETHKEINKSNESH